MRSGGIRAWPSVAMLTGFGLVAVAYLVLVTVPVWLLLSALPGSAAVRLGVPLCIATVGVMGSAIWRALHRRRIHPPGIPIARADAPGLWALIDAAARAAGVRPPDGVTVVADPSAALIEQSHLLGLIGGRRDLYLGMPLLQAWDETHLRAAVAHEFGHEARALGRLAPVAYRGRLAVGRVVPRIPRNNPAGPLIRLWANWYRRVDTPFSRAQELAADRIAADFAGVEAMAAVLRDRPALETLVHVFQTEYVAPGRRAGHIPEDHFGGLLHVLAARADEMAALRHREPPDPPDWEPHPPRRDRLAALAVPTDPAADDGLEVSNGSDDVAPPDDGAEAGRTDGVGAGRVGERPASGGGESAGDLVPDLPGLARALQAVAFPAQGRTALGWEAFFDAARTAEMEREADDAVAAVSRTLEAPLVSAADVLAVAADGRLRKAVEAIFPTGRPRRPRAGSRSWSPWCWRWPLCAPARPGGGTAGRARPSW